MVKQSTKGESWGGSSYGGDTVFGEKHFELNSMKYPLTYPITPPPT